MQLDENEEKLLRSVALQNARAVLVARERAEREVFETKATLERRTRELGEQREWFRVTLSSIGDAVITTDLESKITFLNPVAEMMSGWKFADAIGQPLETVFKIVNERTRLRVESPIAKVLRDGVTVGLANHTALIAKDGRETAIEDSAAPIKDETGKISGAVMVFHDVTEKRKAEKALRESEQKVRAVFNQAAVGMATSTLTGEFEQLNPRFCNILGYTEEELRQHTFRDLTHPHDLAKTEDALQQLLTGDFADVALEKRYIRKDGMVVWGFATITLLKDSNNNPVCFVAVVEDITKRKQAEFERERLVNVLERSLNEIYIFGTESLRFEYVNDGARRNLDYSMEEMRRMTPLDLKPEFTEERFREMVKPLLSGEKDKHIFYTVHRRKNGTLYPVEVHLQAVTQMEHRVFLAVILDITERKKAEEEVRQSELQLRVMADSIPQLAWMAHPDGHIFWYNQGWFDYTGSTVEQAKGWQWQAMHDPKFLPSVIKKWKFSLETGHPFEMEFPLRGADGIFRWFLTRVNPLRDAEGRVVRWFGTNTDVDQVKRASEALREETRVLDLLNKTGTAIASKLDLQDLVQTVTDAGKDLSGAKFGAFFYNVLDEQGESLLLYTLSGAPREAFEKFGHPRATPIFAPTFKGEGVVRSADIMKDPRYGTMAPHYGMPKGHLPVRSYLAVPVISRSGEVIGGLFFGHPEPNIFTERSERLIVGIAAQAAVAIDNARLYEAAQKEIAERKRAETKLQEAKDKLEERVAERTASLQETTDQLEAFCYTIAHDLRSPLRAQQSFAQVLMEDYKSSLDETGRSYAERIIKSAKRLDQLVDDLLSYSRLSRSELKFQKVDLNKIMQSIQVNLANEICGEKATLSIDPLLPVSSFEPTLNLVITNLLTNALKFSKPGVPPQIHIWTEPKENFVRLWVEDNGIGIGPEYQSRIFGVFERLHPMEKYPGTGIGLAIVQKGVERMGGRMGVESEIEKGSRFWIELPKG